FSGGRKAKNSGCPSRPGAASFSDSAKTATIRPCLSRERRTFYRVAQSTAKAVASLWIAVLDSSLLQSVINTQRVVHLPGMKTKQIKMDPKLAGAMKNQLRAFKKKFGREPSRLLLMYLFQQATSSSMGACLVRRF